MRTRGLFRYARYPQLSHKYVYRYYVGFSQEDDPADTRLITVNDSKPNLVILIGGQLRTVMDWWMVRNAGTLSLGTWLPVADPDRTERTCPCTSSLRHGMITNLLRPGLQLQRATIPDLFMHTSDDSGPRVNTQLMWLGSLPPNCFCTTVPIVFLVVRGAEGARIVFQSSGDTCLL